MGFFSAANYQRVDTTTTGDDQWAFGKEEEEDTNILPVLVKEEDVAAEDDPVGLPLPDGGLLLAVKDLVLLAQVTLVKHLAAHVLGLLLGAGEHP